MLEDLPILFIPFRFQVAANVRRKLAESKADIDRCISSAETALSIVVPIFGATAEINDKESTSNGADGVEMQVLFGRF